MAIPLSELINKEDDIYELTCVAIKRAAVITKYGDTELERHEHKVVSTAITQGLEERVEYFYEHTE